MELRVQTIREFIGMTEECLSQAVVSTFESCMDVVVALLDLLIREVQEPAQDGGGP